MSAEVRKYALMNVVTPEFAKDRQALESFMRASLLDGLAREGNYEVVPDSFHLDLVKRGSIDGMVMLSDEEIAAGMTGDEVLARASVRCYDRDAL